MQYPNGELWLQAQKANWKTFGHWDKDKIMATSDKTINLSGSSYRDNPYAVAARVKASVDKMLDYDTDRSKDGTVTFKKSDIGSYVLNLAVPYITDPAMMDKQTSAEWKALCRAFHDATPEWIGEYPLPREKNIEEDNKYFPLYMEFWIRVQEKYGFKDWRDAQTKSALVFANWECEQTDQIGFSASRGRGTSHSAWSTNENQGKIFHVSINASDEELGAVTLQALDARQPNYA